MSGSGSVFRRGDGRWVAAVSIGPRNQRRFIRRIRPTRRDALAALGELRVDRSPAATSRLTVGAYLESWMAGVRNLRPETRRAYQAATVNHLVPTIGHVRLVDLTPLHVEGMLADVGQRVGPKSLRNIHAVLRRALAMAVRGGLVTRNVASREFVDAPRVPLAEPRALSAAEVRRLLDACRGDWLEAVFITAVGTGLRQGELLGLAWEDVDLHQARISVRRELVRENGRYQRVELKTAHSRRAVPLAHAVVEALIAHRGRLILEGFLVTEPGPVFTNRRGEPLSGSWVTHRFYRLADQAGIPRLRFHQLRTTYASRLAEAGVSDIEIARLLGHSRVHTAKKHYIAAGPTSAAALAAIEGLVAGDTPVIHGGVGANGQE
jgi:integrase